MGSILHFTYYLLQLQAQLGSASDLGIPVVRANSNTLNNVLETTFFVIGGLSVIFIVIGGFRYVVSAGDPNNTQQAKNTILYAVIGLVISIFAAGIVNFVLGRFQ